MQRKIKNIFGKQFKVKRIDWDNMPVNGKEKPTTENHFKKRPFELRTNLKEELEGQDYDVDA